MNDVHGVAELPGRGTPALDAQRANVVVPADFGDYERDNHLPIIRPVHVDTVTDDDGILTVHAGERAWRTRTLVNATGTWTQPFLPHYAGMETFLGERLHTGTIPAPITSSASAWPRGSRRRAS